MNKTHFAFAAMLALVAVVPPPASALPCVPVDEEELVKEVRCLSGVDHIQCNGGHPLAAACVLVLQTADTAFDKGEWAEDVARGLPNKVNPSIDALLP